MGKHRRQAMASRTVRLDLGVLERLAAYAEPLVDTPNTAILRLLDICDPILRGLSDEERARLGIPQRVG